MCLYVHLHVCFYDAVFVMIVYLLPNNNQQQHKHSTVNDASCGIVASVVGSNIHADHPCPGIHPEQNRLQHYDRGWGRDTGHRRHATGSHACPIHAPLQHSSWYQGNLLPKMVTVAFVEVAVKFFTSVSHLLLEMIIGKPE